jgi:hypothetical protein
VVAFTENPVIYKMFTIKREEGYIKQLPEWLFVIIPIVAAFIVWFGCTHSGFTPDDSMVINVQSPIRSFVDVISMFWRHDPNPQYWRPFTDATVSLDFLLWGFEGGKFHLTNLLLHCLATGLVYVFTRRIFLLPAFGASVLALIFGVSGSHDANLLWIAARSDIIATIMMLIVLLSARKAEISAQRKIGWLLISYISFFLALASKEVSVVVVALLPLLVYSISLKDLWQKKWNILVKLFPYFIITAVFIIIRLQFTIPLSQMQPLNAEGSHSITAFAKNFLYSIGYSLAPVDFQLAAIIINQYMIVGLIAALIALAIFFLLLKNSSKVTRGLLYKPLALLLITGFVSFQSFERWRVYLPSVGLLAIIIFLFSSLWQLEQWQKMIRLLLLSIAIAFIAFHVSHSLESQKIWEQATSNIASYENDLKNILAKHPERPITLEVITSPTKLGGAGLIQLSKTYLAKKAEADLRHLPQLLYGVIDVSGDSVVVETDVDLYALDPEKGFSSLVFKRTGSNEYEISGDKNEIGLFPNADFGNSKARRDMKLISGGKYETFGTTATIENAEGSFASTIKITLHDSTAVHLYFDGKKIRELDF